MTTTLRGLQQFSNSLAGLAMMKTPWGLQWARNDESPARACNKFQTPGVFVIERFGDRAVIIKWLLPAADAI